MISDEVDEKTFHSFSVLKLEFGLVKVNVFGLVVIGYNSV